MSTRVLQGGKLLCLDVGNAQTPIERKPERSMGKAKLRPQHRELENLVEREGQHIVCQEAGFAGVTSGPLVRSPYRSGRLCPRVMKAKRVS